MLLNTQHLPVRRLSAWNCTTTPPTPTCHVAVLSTLNVTGPLPCAAPVEQCPVELTGPTGTVQLCRGSDSGLPLCWNLPNTAFRQWTLQLASPCPILFTVDNEICSINTKKRNSWMVRWCGKVLGPTVKFMSIYGSAHGAIVAGFC